MNINRQTFRAMTTPEDPRKIGRVLHRLACGNTFNRFQTERWLNDHVLNSTISELANRHRISINREWETVPGFDQKPTRCVRYSIDSSPANLVRCYWLLRSWGWRDQQSEADTTNPPPETA